MILARILTLTKHLQPLPHVEPMGSDEIIIGEMILPNQLADLCHIILCGKYSKIKINACDPENRKQKHKPQDLEVPVRTSHSTAENTMTGT